jgi:hypothetical protein
LARIHAKGDDLLGLELEHPELCGISVNSQAHERILTFVKDAIETSQLALNNTTDCKSLIAKRSVSFANIGDSDKAPSALNQYTVQSSLDLSDIVVTGWSSN